VVKAHDANLLMSNLIRESTYEILHYLGKPDGVFRIEPSFLGEIPYVRDTLIKAEMARTPVMEMFPRSGATTAFKSIANALRLLPSRKDGGRLRPELLAEWIEGEPQLSPAPEPEPPTRRLPRQ
jgi:hypothetical protein